MEAMPASKKLIQAIAVTAELTGTTLSEAAAELLVEDLEAYPEAQVLKALQQCRKELKGRLTPAQIIERIDDGRPGVEEAWAMLPRSEDQTVVWTEEMAEAYSPIRFLILEDEIAARMAFKEVYTAKLSEVRASFKPVNWTASVGHDPMGRQGPIIEAVQKGRLPAAYAQKLLPDADIDTGQTLIAGPENKNNLKRIQNLIESTGLTKK
jgi:hypothetical protein